MIHISVISKEEQELKRVISHLSSQADIKIIGTGRDDYAALKTATELHPDIVIMDLPENSSDGAELAPLIRRKSPSTKLIVISMLDASGWIRYALRAGISGFVSQQFSEDMLINAVRTVHYGGYYFGIPTMSHAYNYFPAMDSWIATEAELKTNAGETQAMPVFSVTERKVIILIVKGYLDKEIAEELRIAPGTVRNCLAAIKRKTGLKNRTQLVIYLIIHGFVGLPPESSNSRQRYI